MDKISQKSFRLLKKIKDPKFEIDRLEYYNLCLYIGVKDFQILIIDSDSNHCVLLEDYVFDPKLEDGEKFAVIKFIFDDHHLLLANFWKAITIIIKNRVFSFVPKELFNQDRISSYLKMNSSYNSSQDEVMLTFHKHLDFVNVFSVPKSIVELILNYYPDKKIKFAHQSSSLINGVISKNEYGHKDVVLYIDRFGLHILIVNDKKLIFYNQYSIKKFDDYIKYIKLVATKLIFDLEQDQIYLYGYLGKKTPHFNELKKTMHQLTLGRRPENLNFGYVFDEVLEHQYFDLFSADS
ncbi:MAG: DUF3822 family protein [Cyclobacteriaceae bacterium]|nr:DUF3822 family protein [Cyclobacteriaceae bacterium]